MARPPRRDFPGATHHVFSRGVARSIVAVDAEDYDRALFFLERAIKRFELGCHGWCYLPNHFHLLVSSPLGNISRAMHWLGSCTAQAFNERHERSGHLYQGRFGSRLVETDAHFLELARYLPLNPVRAGLSRSPGEWPWSSYAATAGLRAAPWFLDVDSLLGTLGSPDAYIEWVGEGVDPRLLDDSGAPMPEAKLPLASLLSDRSDAAIAGAHEHGHSKAAIAEHLGLSRWQVNRRLARSAHTGSDPARAGSDPMCAATEPG